MELGMCVWPQHKGGIFLLSPAVKPSPTSTSDWIEKNFDRSFSYDDLARKSGMSRRTLERRFKSATGETPLTYQQGIPGRSRQAIAGRRDSFVRYLRAAVDQND
jgi:AraC-like DNA-binding protein